MIEVIQKDGYGGGKRQRISGEGASHVVVHPHPPIREDIAPLPYSQYFTDNGTSTGSNDMRVDGSGDFVEFYISALEEMDIYIKSITIQISDPGARLDRFGALTALTNGIEFFYHEKAIGDLVINDSIKTNLDFFRDATGGKDFGDGTGAWKADIAGGGGEDTYFPSLDLGIRFGLVWGLRLVAGTDDRLSFRIKDDLSTGISTFNIKGYGIRV
jgi:hypothetical protein